MNTCENYKAQKPNLYTETSYKLHINVVKPFFCAKRPFIVVIVSIDLIKNSKHNQTFNML